MLFWILPLSFEAVFWKVPPNLQERLWLPVANTSTLSLGTGQPQPLQPDSHWALEWLMSYSLALLFLCITSFFATTNPLHIGRWQLWVATEDPAPRAQRIKHHPPDRVSPSISAIQEYHVPTKQNPGMQNRATRIRILPTSDFTLWDK